MGGGLAFLTKKSFNPANWSNQRLVWEARQKNETEKRRLVERESQIKREREEEELARVVGGEEEGGRKALGFVYEAGKVPGLDRKSNGQNDDEIGGGVPSSGQEGVGESLFERQPGDDDAAAAFRAMLARGAAADEPAPQQAAAAAQADAQEGDSAEGTAEEDEKRPWENDHRTNLEKAVGRGINAGSGVTLAQQMERFPMLKGAPMVLQKPQGGGDSKKEGSAVNVAGLNFKPLGQVLRNIQCLNAQPVATAVLATLALSRAQHQEGTPQQLEAVAVGEAALAEQLLSHPDVVDAVKVATEAYDSNYRVSFPPTEDFVIGLLVNPCGANGTYGRDDDVANGWDCCMNRFGQGEYAFRPGTRNRFSNGYSNGIPTSPDEPLHNIDLVDEHGNALDFRYSRRADDVLYIDESCVGLRDPHSACIADRFAAAGSKMTPACWDHNQTVDATLDCYTPVGKKKPHCVQVAYSQNAFISVCGGEFANDDRCGTWLEIHKENGTPYDDEATILSETKLTTPVTNGFLTTTMSLHYKGDPSRILCSYEESTISVGSMVRINNKASSCCCPPWLSPIRKSKIGAFLCPKRQGSKDGGPFAPALKSLEEEYADADYQQAFPLCPDLGKADEDALLCTQERLFTDIPPSHPSRYFVRPCMPLVEAEDDGGHSSADLSGVYDGVCPLGDTFRGCGLASSGGGCQEKDSSFRFTDEIGKVVHVPDPDNSDDKYGVSFNDGRSVYWFEREELDFLMPEGNYQLWFVQRNRLEKIVQKKKPFRVTWPRCTFDTASNRYFPYAQLDNTGKPLAAS
ncbi:hypothetical protein ACHAXT_004654 [Thalassiosira profunda]